MNFDHYSDCAPALAADLVNERPTEAAAVRELLARHRVSFVREVTEADVADIQVLCDQLREVLTSTDLPAVVALVNRLLAQSRAQPRLSDHDGEPLHLHYEHPEGRLAEKPTADLTMGLAAVIVRDGLDRFRTCAADDCADVFVDVTRNRSRRYCDPETCGNRAHVAAHRARRRAARSAAG